MQSVVYEFKLPDKFEADLLLWVSPQVVWSFSNANLFYGKISGAYRLPNGNTLICKGDYGYWEVSTSGGIVLEIQ